MNNVFYLIPAVGLIALVVMMIKSAWVSKQDAGNDRMKEIAGYVAEGAMAFLKAEYRILAIFMVIAGIGLGVLSQMVPSSHWLIVVAFVVGCVFSALAGFFGMKIATKANVRTTEAARTSLAKALKVSFTGGTVMGLGVAGLAVLGLGMLFVIFFQFFMQGSLENGGVETMTRVLEVLAGFSVGAESIALFARVGGGIYTKAADVGADLVGKVEAGIPEDDPRNPATIADNVGDNVGDVAGMGADLFGSYVATVLASMVLGNYVIRDVLESTGGFGNIEKLTLDDARVIYYRDYWLGSGAKVADISPELAMIMFDTAVNMGVGTSIRFPQRVLHIKEDGIFGPVTKNTLETADIPATIDWYMTNRILRYADLEVWSRYRRGWVKRATSLLRQAFGGK